MSTPAQEAAPASTIATMTPNPTTRTLLRDLAKKMEKMMADITALTAAINALDADEVAAVAELQKLATTIAGLETGQVTQAQIDELTTHAEAVATALAAGTAAA